MNIMIGRPSPTEAAPYYFTYINQVVGENPLATIESQLDESLVFFSTISEEKSKHRYGPDKWSIREVLNHVTDTERAFAFRALWFARGFDVPLPSYDQEIAAKGAAVMGVSTQDFASHAAFTRKYRLNFPLLADTGGAVGRAYGTLGGRGLVARLKTAAGLADRVTFVIGADGRIAHVIDHPDVARHAEEVLALL